MGIGGWLTNYKRFNVIRDERRMVLTVGDYEHFESYITRDDVANIASMGMDHVRVGFDHIVYGTTFPRPMMVIASLLLMMIHDRFCPRVF